MGCAIVTKYALGQRWKLGRMTLQLQQSNAQLLQQSETTAALAAAQERNTMSRDEIHDTVGHGLTVVGAQLDSAVAQLNAVAAQLPAAAGGALDALAKARRANQEGLVEIRRSVSAMRATPLDGRSLLEGIQALVEATQHPDLQMTLEQTGTPRPLPALVELTLYRCAQEGLTNACRHAKASAVHLHLDFDSASHATLVVSDNGTGFAPDVSGGGIGLKGLRERAILLNGAFTLGTSPTGGTFVQMVLPSCPNNDALRFTRLAPRSALPSPRLCISLLHVLRISPHYAPHSL